MSRLTLGEMMSSLPDRMCGIAAEPREVKRMTRRERFGGWLFFGAMAALWAAGNLWVCGIGRLGF